MCFRIERSSCAPKRGSPQAPAVLIVCLGRARCRMLAWPHQARRVYPLTLHRPAKSYAFGRSGGAGAAMTRATSSA